MDKEETRGSDIPKETRSSDAPKEMESRIFFKEDFSKKEPVTVDDSTE
jgi:hypothetical protein